MSNAIAIFRIRRWRIDSPSFRFMPHQKPYEIFYPVNGVSVDREGTHCDMHSCHVRLTNLIKNESSGAYRCEVSSEAPAFRLASETHNVTVAGKKKTVQLFYIRFQIYIVAVRQSSREVSFRSRDRNISVRFVK